VTFTVTERAAGRVLAPIAEAIPPSIARSLIRRACGFDPMQCSSFG
jgi:hypothetical protein